MGRIVSRGALFGSPKSARRRLRRPRYRAGASGWLRRACASRSCASSSVCAAAAGPELACGVLLRSNFEERLSETCALSRPETDLEEIRSHARRALRRPRAVFSGKHTLSTRDREQLLYRILWKHSRETEIYKVESDAGARVLESLHGVAARLAHSLDFRRAFHPDIRSRWARSF